MEFTKQEPQNYTNYKTRKTQLIQSMNLLIINIDIAA